MTRARITSPTVPRVIPPMGIPGVRDAIEAYNASRFVPGRRYRYLGSPDWTISDPIVCVGSEWECDFVGDRYAEFESTTLAAQMLTLTRGDVWPLGGFVQLLDRATLTGLLARIALTVGRARAQGQERAT